jgi:hypothetical protein
LEKDLVGAMEEEGEEAGEGDEVEMKDVVELLSSSTGNAVKTVYQLVLNLIQ